MKDYLLLIRGSEAGMEGLTPEQSQEHMQKWGAFMGSLTESGNLAGGLPLTQDGRVLTGNGASNGLVASDKGETIGGYLLLKANDYDHAVELSKGCPAFELNGNIEIREAMQMEM